MANNTKYITLENLKKYDELLKTYIAAHASSGSSSAFRVEKVDTLPNASDAEAGVLYVVTNGTNEEGQRFDEYMLVDGAMEKVGSSSIDLSGYYTKTEVEEAIAAYAPFEVVTELPTVDTAITSKIYVLTEEYNGKQKGSYVLANSEWVSVGTTVTPATNPEVAESTQNNGGNDPDPNDPNQGGNGGNSGNDPDPNQGGNTDPTPPSPITYTFTLTADDKDALDAGAYRIDDFWTALAQEGITITGDLYDYMDNSENDGKIQLYYVNRAVNPLANDCNVEIPYETSANTISAATLGSTTGDTNTWLSDSDFVSWTADVNTIGLTTSAMSLNTNPIFKIVYNR